ncbi:AGAP001107-PB [Anopheles gambiae str. PEST]|uniref:AGAP001107-PA n=1 Tax=Anopheles gambiae TaxID=7165 RepID=A0NH96_ANOGA|nr:AGAP001107-PA [Anopheles gambiae str. PEST]EGK97665.1 AGAP001107-PB [Anopheles gambiae str. PEST]
MEEPDRDAAHVGAVGKVDTRNDALTVSFSSEDSDSWTLLGKESDRQSKEPSGVQEVIKEEVTVEEGKGQPSRKQRHDSHRSTDSQLDESSDGISIISESDASSLPMEEDLHDDRGTVHFSRTIDLKAADYEPLTPPFTPDDVKTVKEEGSIQRKREVQVKHADENSVEPVQSMVEHSPVSNANWIIFSLIATGMVAVILGNSMRLQNRVNEINFEHEKRISELELENNILKNEMNKLRHLYTRSELDEQVQRAEFEWMDALREANVVEPTEDYEEPTREAKSAEAGLKVEQMVRKVPPQDSGVKRKVVWSGDEEEPMLIVDKDYVLPAFCYNKDQAVHDDLFSEYSAKYCDVKKRKIESKQKKAEFQQKQQTKQENYNKFINPATLEPSQEKRSDPSKPASPFNIDYQKAFDAIKAEGSVIVDALGSILDLSPEPEDSLGAKVRKVTAEATTPEILDVKAELLEPDHHQESKELKHDDRKQRKYRPEEKKTHKPEDNSHSSGESQYSKRKDGSNHSTHESRHKKQKNGRADNGKYENKESQREYGSYEQKKFVEDSSHKKSHKKKHDDDGKHKYVPERNNGRYSDSYISADGSDDDDDDDEDDHYKKKFDQRETFSDHNHDGKSSETNRAKQTEALDERIQHIREPAGEGSYLEQYKRAESKKGKRHQEDDYYHGQKHNKHANKQQQQRKDGDWNEKRYKGRDEYRQNGGKHGERGSGDQHWQERTKHGRQEARDEQRKRVENNWYLERGNQREEDRIFH